jgi:hypothetical protein
MKIQIRLLLLSIFMASVSIVAVSAQSVTTSGVLWEPVDIQKQNLYYGPGGASLRPNLRRVTLIRRETGGNNLKYRIRDASGRVWVAKIADESQPEVAAVRLLWAIGYKTETNYIARTLRIPGKEVYHNASLELRPEGYDREERWRWDDNPFNGTNEMAGLKMMMAMFNNWDLKDDNNLIIKTGQENYFVISDLGSSFGKLPVHSAVILNRIGRSVNDPSDYVKSDFIEGTTDGEIEFSYKGKAVNLFDGITVEQGRWLAALLTQLSDKQIADAFRAANYNATSLQTLTRAFRARINALSRATSGNTVAEQLL